MNGTYETNTYMQKFFLNSHKQHRCDGIRTFLLVMKQHANELQTFVGYF